jgi:DNA-binding response OmpR family regulator
LSSLPEHCIGDLAKELMNKKILIAEDDPDILFILDTILNDAGFNVESLTEGSTIVERTAGWPDLFILDKEMPMIDGLAICKYLKVKEETKNIPIIMISAYHKLKKRAKEVGVDDFIEKPFELKHLLHVIGKYVDMHDNRSNRLANCT